MKHYAIQEDFLLSGSDESPIWEKSKRLVSAEELALIKALTAEFAAFEQTEGAELAIRMRKESIAAILDQLKKLPRS